MPATIFLGLNGFSIWSMLFKDIRLRTIAGKKIGVTLTKATSTKQTPRLDRQARQPVCLSHVSCRCFKQRRRWCILSLQRRRELRAHGTMLLLPPIKRHAPEQSGLLSRALKQSHAHEPELRPAKSCSGYVWTPLCFQTTFAFVASRPAAENDQEPGMLIRCASFNACRTSNATGWRQHFAFLADAERKPTLPRRGLRSMAPCQSKWTPRRAGRQFGHYRTSARLPHRRSVRESGANVKSANLFATATPFRVSPAINFI